MQQFSSSTATTGRPRRWHRPGLVLALVLLCLTGRAQVANYTFAESSGTYTNITTGTVLDNNTITDGVYTVALPTPFWFDGAFQSTMYVSVNGFITFGSAPGGTNYTPLNSTATYTGAISPFGIDLEDASSGTNEVRWAEVSDEIVVQWRDLIRVASSGTERFSFQARLNTTNGQIKFVYATVNNPGTNTSSPQVGLRGPNNTFATNVKNRLVNTGSETWAATLAGTANSSTMRFTSTSPARVPANGQTYTFTPPCFPPTATATLGATDCTAGTFAVSVDVTSLGSASNVDIVASPGGVLQDNVGTGTYDLTFTNGTPVTLTVTHNGNSACNLSLGSFVNSTTCFPNGVCSQNVTITDNDCITRGISSTASGTLGSGVLLESVELIITHTTLNQLTLTLTSPSGVTRQLITSRFGSGDNMGNNTTCTPLILKDGGIALTNANTSGSTSTYNPEQSLAGFTGAAAGTWKLNICDNSSGTVGALRYAKLNFCTPASITGTTSNSPICSGTTLNLGVTATGPGTLAYTWSGTGTISGGGTANASVTGAATGNYTISVSNGCGSAATATVPVTVNTPANAGTNGTFAVCSSAASFNLQTKLGGSPQNGGAWTFNGNPHSATFVPGTDVAGVYTYTVTGTAPCANASATVTVTVDQAPTIFTGSYGPYCSNAATATLTGSPVGGTWSGTGVSGNTFNPNAGSQTLTYTVVNGACTTSATTAITVNQAPTGVTAGSSAASVCANANTVNLTSAGSGATATILDENFNAATNSWTKTNSSTGGTTTARAAPAWTLRPNAYNWNGSANVTFNSNDNTQFYLSNSDASSNSVNTETMLASPAFSTVGYASASLSFYHVFRQQNGGSDQGIVEASTNGSTWTALQTYTATQGAANGFVQATVALTAPFIGQPTVFVRFHFIADFGWYWAVDNVHIAGAALPAFSWASTPAGFTSSQQNPTGVAVTQNTTYTVTATANGCSATANTSVSVVAPPNAGTNGTLATCSNGSAVSLFAQLGGTPAAGGAWTGPSTVTGGNYNPVTMNPGVYTYTVTGTAPCANATATVTVTENAAPNAGTNGTFAACSNGASFNLQSKLGGSPQGGGSWTFGGNPHSATFDPAIDAAGVYTYTVNGTAPCANATATVTVTVDTPPTVTTGSYGPLCSNGASIPLNGASPVGGAWSGTGVSGGNFNPSAGTQTVTYTYVNGGCTTSASTSIQVNQAANAGSNGTFTACSDGASFSLQSKLGGSPQSGGSWTFGGNPHGATFVPGTDAAGVYTYTVTGTAPCANATATVTVTVNQAPDAGTNGAIAVCETDAPFSLFTVLGGTPMAGGSWTLNGASHSTTFTPGTDVTGTYVYTVTGASPCTNATAQVSVTQNPTPSTAVNVTVNSYAICQNGTVPGGQGLAATCAPISRTTSISFPGSNFISEGTTLTTRATLVMPPVPAGATVTAARLKLFSVVANNGSFGQNASRANIRVALSGAYTLGLTQLTTTTGPGTVSPNPVITLASFPASGGTINLQTRQSSDQALANPDATIASALIEVDYTVPTTVRWYDAPSAGTLVASTSVLDPVALSLVDNTVSGDHTYYATCGFAACENIRTAATFHVNAPANAGGDASITVCSTDAAFSMQSLLTGTPQGGGTWSGPSPVIDSNYDPATMVQGTYTYTVAGNAPCPNDAATVAVTETQATLWYADADGDGSGDPGVSVTACAQPDGYVASNGDGCPNDPNKLAPGQCGCGVADTDTDGDGTADCNDGCPNDPNKLAPGVCGCGVADVATTYYADVDGDGVGDPNSSIAGFTCIVPVGYVTSNTDGCPSDPNKLAPGQCGCGNVDTDTDADGTADCNDGCPNDPNKLAPGVCGCGVPDTDSDADGTADCNDGCPNDPNKVAPGVCGCGVADVPTTYYADADGDGLGDPNNSITGYTCIVPGGYVANNNDACTSVPGTVGSSCNDNNPFTTNDVLNASCTCAGTPVACDSWTLIITTDNAGSETTWSITDANSPYVLATGGPLMSNGTFTSTVCIPQGACFNLRVNDAGGNGMGHGGYVLRDGLGRRVIDNAGNGAGFTSFSQAPQPFCNPMGSDHLIDSDCDVEDRLPNDVIIASENPAVSAQWGVGDQTDDGYEFWFFNPNGGYSRTIFHNHATTLGQGPANAIRASKLPLNSMVTLPPPQNTLLNVRVRARVNGVAQPWGPVCRLKIDVAAANCPATHLIDTPGQTLSCGVTGLLLNSSSRIWAVPVHRAAAGGAIQMADHYRFHFVNAGEGYSRDFTQVSYCVVLTQWATLPLQYGQTYDVTVQASFDGGNTWCPAGKTCQISFAAMAPGGRPDRIAIDGPQPTIAMWPNPNHGEQLYLTMEGIDASLATVTVNVIDLVGQQVMGTTLPVADGSLNTVLDLKQSMSDGVYLLQVTAGEKTYTQRLVVQK